MDMDIGIGNYLYILMEMDAGMSILVPTLSQTCNIYIYI